MNENSRTAPTGAMTDALANYIRVVDGNNKMGAGTLAEEIMGFFQPIIAERDSLREQALALRQQAAYETNVAAEALSDRDRLAAEVLRLTDAVMDSDARGARLHAERDAIAVAAHDLMVQANSVEYCYRRRPENFAVALQCMADDCEAMRIALSPATNSPANEASLASGTGSEVGK